MKGRKFKPVVDRVSNAEVAKSHLCPSGVEVPMITERIRKGDFDTVDADFE